jgi:hypothetical protein
MSQIEKPMTTAEFAEAMRCKPRALMALRSRLGEKAFPKPLNPGDRRLLWPAPLVRAFVEGSRKLS